MLLFIYSSFVPYILLLLSSMYNFLLNRLLTSFKFLSFICPFIASCLLSIPFYPSLPSSLPLGLLLLLLYHLLLLLKHLSPSPAFFLIVYSFSFHLVILSDFFLFSTLSPSLILPPYYRIHLLLFTSSFNLLLTTS
jgi:hypothetical protein